MKTLQTAAAHHQDLARRSEGFAEGKAKIGTALDLWTYPDGVGRSQRYPAAVFDVLHEAWCFAEIARTDALFEGRSAQGNATQRGREARDLIKSAKGRVPDLVQAHLQDALTALRGAI